MWVRTRRRAGGREDDGANTEPKTKTPHVNVGKNGYLNISGPTAQRTGPMI